MGTIFCKFYHQLNNFYHLLPKIHSLYSSFFDNPPEGVEYKRSEFWGVSDKNYSIGGKIYKKLYPFFSFLIGGFHQKFNDLLRKEFDSDLVFFCFHLGKSKKPCVASYEHAFNFLQSENPMIYKNVALKLLCQKNLKYLIPINKEALKSFKICFPEIDKKIKQEIVYPVPDIDFDISKIKKKNRIIFIGSANITTDFAFAVKGGYETVLAFQKLAEKYKNYEFVVISNIPSDFSIKKLDNLKIHSIMPHDDVLKLMAESKIFVQPNYHTPTMSFLEAMNMKLPIIAYDCWANSEYVDNKNGILIKPKPAGNINEYNIPFYTNEIINKIRQNAEDNSLKLSREIEKLMKNPKMIEKKSEDGYKKVKYGKFSIENMNDKFKKIYRDSLK
jgi:hypothetical protein